MTTLRGASAPIPELSVVIPIYHEQENIALTLATLVSQISVAHEILCVYDQDDDPTLPVLRDLQIDLPQLRWVKNVVAPGPSGALRSGFQAASGERILVAMADLCDDFSQIEELLRLVPTAGDIACPSRYCPGGFQEMVSPLKVGLPRLAGRLLRWLTGLPTYDPTNSYKLYSGSLIRRLRLTSTVSFSVTLEVVAKAHFLGYRICEIPTTWRDRQHGESRFRISPAIPAYLKWFLVALLRNRVFRLPATWGSRWERRPAQHGAGERTAAGRLAPLDEAGSPLTHVTAEDPGGNVR